MAFEAPTLGQELASLPLGEMIYSIARAIADGQFHLDKSSVRAAEYLSGRVLLRDENTGRLVDRAGRETKTPNFVDTLVYFGYSYDASGQRRANQLSMMELGFVPTFYQFVDTLIEVKVALQLKKEGMVAGAQGNGVVLPGSGAPVGEARTVINTTPVDARYASSYNYSAEMACKLTTKLVPVPPPAILEERIRTLNEQARIDQSGKSGTAGDKDVIGASRIGIDTRLTS